MISGVCGESTSEIPHVGGFTASDSATCTLSKLAKRSSGCELFQSTMGGAFAVSQPGNQLVLATCNASVLTLGQTAGSTSSSTTMSYSAPLSMSWGALLRMIFGDDLSAFSRKRLPRLTSNIFTGAGNWLTTDA